MLYNFQKLSIKLDQLGFPKADKRSFEPERTELNREELAGTIDFRDDGVYRTIEGVEYRGYMYLKRYFIKRYDGKFPKFHITKCSTVADIEKRIDFVWDRSVLAKIQDRDNHQMYEGKLLLCDFCKMEASIAPKTTEDFRKLLDAEDEKDLDISLETGLDKRALNWMELSKAYRIEKNYTCEKCGFGGEMLENKIDREFLHTDHIIAWELTNMKRSNLMCLCFLCHSQKDERHIINFSKPGMQKRLKRFIDKYGKKLKEIGNPYIDNI